MSHENDPASLPLHISTPKREIDLKDVFLALRTHTGDFRGGGHPCLGDRKGLHHYHRRGRLGGGRGAGEEMYIFSSPPPPVSSLFKSQGRVYIPTYSAAQTDPARCIFLALCSRLFIYFSHFFTLRFFRFRRPCPTKLHRAIDQYLCYPLLVETKTLSGATCIVPHG